MGRVRNQPTSAAGPDGIEVLGSVIFVVLGVFILGFYVIPSNRELGSAPHDLLFFFCVLPVFVVLGGKDLWRALRLGDSGVRLLGLGLAFIVYLGASAVWTTGDRELSPWGIVLNTLGTAVFLVGSSQVLVSGRWLRLRVVIVAVATAVTSASIIAHFLGFQTHPGRLSSVIHFEHPNLFAHYVGFAALICWSRLLEMRRSGGRDRWAWATAGLILAAALVLTLGRAPMGAGLVAAVLGLLLTRDRILTAAFALVIVTVAGGFFIVGGDWGPSLISRGEAGRLFIYQTLIERMDGRWLTGVGLAASDDVVFPKGNDAFPKGFDMPHTHSAFVATFYHGGVLGLALLVVLIGEAGCQAWRVARQRGDPTGLLLLTFGVFCLTFDGNRLVSNPHLSSWLIFWFPIAWIIAAGRWDDSRATTSPGDR